METIKKNIKAIIFDMDGTIIKTEHIWIEGTFIFLAKHTNADISQEAVKKFVHSLAGHSQFSVARHLYDYLKGTWRKEDIQEKRLACVREALANQTSTLYIEGFEDFHRQLREHQMPSCIATNATIEGLMHYADKMGFHDIFGKHLYSISHVNLVAKPDPAVFLHAAQQLGVDPSECVVFEDSNAGFQAAKAAGMKCIAIKNDINGEHLHQVHGVIDDYRQALDALRTLSGLHRD